MECKDFEELYWLKAYGEAVPGGDDGLIRHLESCRHCRAKAQELDKVRALLTIRAPQEAQPEALQAARRRLMARLETRRSPADRAKEWLKDLKNLRAPRWEIGLALGALAAGLLIGRWVFQPGGKLTPIINESQRIQPATYQEETDLRTNRLLEEMLRGQSRITDLRVRPAADQQGLVDVSFKAEKEFAIQGKPDDRLILELLGWAVKHAENSGVRLQSVEGLAGASKLDERARQVLAWALVNDRNDGVRLKALEALENVSRDALVEDAILNALLKDSNPAVRIRAIDALLAGGGTAQKSAAALLAAAQADSNDYVRMQARRAIRETHDDYRMLEGRHQMPSGVRIQEVGKGGSK
jgi:hypothetical protein